MPSRPDAGMTPDAQAPIADASTDARVGPVLRTFRSRFLYLVMPDRFVDGDPPNNEISEVDTAGCYDVNHPTSFHGGDMAGLAASTSYLEELGVGAVWMTPVARQVPGCGYHGYWQNPGEPNRAEVDSRFGTLSDLADLTSALHERDIHLVIDLVINHTGNGADLISEHPDWFHRASTCSSSGNSDWDCPLAGLPDFAQEKAAVSEYLIEGSLSWLARSGADGVRLDAAKHVPSYYLKDEWLPALKAEHPELYTIGEIFSNDPRTLEIYLNTGFTSIFNFPLQTAFVNTIAAGASVDQIAAVLEWQGTMFGVEKQLDLVNMLDNHDLDRFASHCLLGRSVPLAAQRYQLALAALFTLPGVPQLTWGGELGMLGGRDPDNRSDMPKWASSAAARSMVQSAEQFLGDPESHHAWVVQLAKLRNQHPALYDGTYTELRRQDSQANLLAFVRATQDEAILVLLNNGDSDLTDLSIDLTSKLSGAAKALIHEGGELVDLFERDAAAQVKVRSGHVSVSIPARGVAAYRIGSDSLGSVE